MATRSHHHNLLTATAIVIGTLLIVNYGFYYAVVRMATEGRMRGAEDDSDAVWSVFRDDDGVCMLVLMCKMASSALACY